MNRQKMGVASSQLMLAQSFRCFENSRNVEVLLKLLNLNRRKALNEAKRLNVWNDWNGSTRVGSCWWGLNLSCPVKWIDLKNATIAGRHGDLCSCVEC